jgi:hypothetical protein
VERVLTEHTPLPGRVVGEVLEADRWASTRAREITKS